MARVADPKGDRVVIILNGSLSPTASGETRRLDLVTGTPPLTSLTVTSQGV